MSLCPSNSNATFKAEVMTVKFPLGLIQRAIARTVVPEAMIMSHCPQLMTLPMHLFSSFPQIAGVPFHLPVYLLYKDCSMLPLRASYIVDFCLPGVSSPYGWLQMKHLGSCKETARLLTRLFEFYLNILMSFGYADHLSICMAGVI
jgi:hypothetical protein